MKNKSQILSLVMVAFLVVFIILRTNIGGLFFAVVVLILIGALTNLYQKSIVSKETLRKKRYQSKNEYEYYDTKTKTIKKIRKE